uniref:Uncharacterized protein n=1 Tax=Fagus sylvatica TaxID=28930 RepID=A0A2N9F6D0_FAGSY
MAPGPLHDPVGKSLSSAMYTARTLEFKVIRKGCIPDQESDHRLTGLRVDGLTPTFNAFPAHFQVDREYLGLDLGATITNLPSLLLAFAEAPQDTAEKRTRMARAFLLYLIGTTLDCNTSQTVPVRWLHLLVDFQQIA